MEGQVGSEEGKQAKVCGCGSTHSPHVRQARPCWGPVDSVGLMETNMGGEVWLGKVNLPMFSPLFCCLFFKYLT